MVKSSFMREVRVEDAVGMQLGHDLTQIIPGQFKGRLFKAGHVITEEDIPRLLDIGKRHIFVMEIPGGFLHENEAAERMANALAGNQYIEKTEPYEGKVTLKSTIHGLLKVDPTLVHRVNQIEGLALATLTSNQVVRPGQALAGVRPIPLIIEEEKIAAVEKLPHLPAITVKPFLKKRVGVVTTGSEVLTGRIKDKFGPAVREKLEQFGSEIVEQRLVNDDMESIVQDIRYFLECKVDMILVTGGMSVDPDDRTPGAIKASGARIVRYGTPMLPGSMLLIAYHGATPILGLPGCVMHDPFTSFDVFLPRILAGESIEEADITMIGYGGYYTC